MHDLRTVALCFPPSAESRCHTVHDTSQAMHARRAWGFPAPSRACRQKALLVDIMAVLCVYAEVIFSAVTSISQLLFQLARGAKTVEFYILSESLFIWFVWVREMGFKRGRGAFYPYLGIPAVRSSSFLPIHPFHSLSANDHMTNAHDTLSQGGHAIIRMHLCFFSSIHFQPCLIYSRKYTH